MLTTRSILRIIYREEQKVNVSYDGRNFLSKIGLGGGRFFFTTLDGDKIVFDDAVVLIVGATVVISPSGQE